MPFPRKPTERLSADELDEIHELEWAIACLNYDIVRLQCRDEYIAGQEAAITRASTELSKAQE